VSGARAVAKLRDPRVPPGTAMPRSLLAGLNDDQRRAVETTEGPLLVLAGAGSGKTRVVTTRIAYLLSRGVPAGQVLAMTFTNKAAGEMRERVASLVGRRRATELTVGTFHAFCARVLREHGERVGLPRRFSICDTADQQGALKGALRELRVAETVIHPRELAGRISLMKNRLVEPDAYLARAADDREELIGRAWLRYADQLRRARAVDFDDLLLLVRRLLHEDEETRTLLQGRFGRVMVDEYQDTNAAQYEIVAAIAAEHRNLCVVGDDDQSIYGWRGADVRRILGFERDFPGAVVVRLQTNYRSTDAILATANRLIAHNGERHEKTLRSALGWGPEPRLLKFEDEIAEAEWVVDDLATAVRRREIVADHVAILVRTQTQPRVIEAQLRAREVPYVVVGGPSFFDRKEVRDVLAFLRLVDNPDDEVSLLRVANVPPRGVGATSIKRLVEHAAAEGVGVPRLLDRGGELAGVGATARGALDELRATLSALGTPEPGRDLVERIRRLLDEVGYRAEVERCYGQRKDREDRWLAVLEVLDLAENHVRRERAPTLSGFLERLALTANDDETDDDRGRGVRLMTLHAAKGLEFPRVYVVGVEEGLLPHRRAVVEDTIDEERRLLYVGITRARRELTLSFAASRSRYGIRVETMPSRFLYEIRGEAPPEGWRPAGAQTGEEAARARKKTAGRGKGRKRRLPPGRRGARSR